MNQTFDHNLTPEPLKSFNQTLSHLIEADEKDYSAIFQTVTQRDEFIRSYLASLEGDQRKAFAAQEKEVNDLISARVNQLFEEAKQEIHHFVKSQAAIKNYR